MRKRKRVFNFTAIILITSTNKFYYKRDHLGYHKQYQILNIVSKLGNAVTSLDFIAFYILSETQMLRNDFSCLLFEDHSLPLSQNGC